MHMGRREHVRIHEAGANTRQLASPPSWEWRTHGSRRSITTCEQPNRNMAAEDRRAPPPPLNIGSSWSAPPCAGRAAQGKRRKRHETGPEHGEAGAGCGVIGWQGDSLTGLNRAGVRLCRRKRGCGRRAQDVAAARQVCSPAEGRIGASEQASNHRRAKLFFSLDAYWSISKAAIHIAIVVISLIAISSL